MGAVFHAALFTFLCFLFVRGASTAPPSAELTLGPFLDRIKVLYQQIQISVTGDLCTRFVP